MLRSLINAAGSAQEHRIPGDLRVGQEDVVQDSLEEVGLAGSARRDGFARGGFAPVISPLGIFFLDAEGRSRVMVRCTLTSAGISLSSEDLRPRRMHCGR